MPTISWQPTPVAVHAGHKRFRPRVVLFDGTPTRSNAWAADPREAHLEGGASRNEWRQATSCTDTICGAEKGALPTNQGCGREIPAGESHALKAYAWRGQVKGRVWASHFHNGCVLAEITATNTTAAERYEGIVLICKNCGRFLGYQEGHPHIVWHGRCDGPCLEKEGV